VPVSKVRVVGSGYTTFTYNGKALKFLEQVEDSGQRAFSDAGAAFQFIQPIGYEHPIEIATSRVLQGGQLTLTLREEWIRYVWQQLPDLANTNNIVDVFKQLAAAAQYATCQLVIRPPTAAGKPRGKNYYNCTIVDISDNDTVTVGGLAVTKGIVIAYTHSGPLKG